MTEFKAARTHLAGVTVSTFVDKDKKLWTEKGNSTFKEGLLTLCASETLSVPVFDEENKKWLSFDVLDLLAHLNTVFGEKLLNTEEMERLFDSKIEGLGDLAPVEDLARESWDKLSANRLLDLCNLSGRNKFETVPLDGNALDAATLMVEHKLHRVGVVDESGELVGIVTQSDLMKLLDGHIKVQATVKDLKLGLTGLPISANATEATILATMVMHGIGVSGLAVVDDDNHLVGALSAHDLKGLYFTQAEFMKQLFAPVGEFLEKQKETPVVKRPHGVVTASGDDTLQSVTEKIVSNRVHRVFVVRPDRFVEGVISLGDVLKHIVKDEK